MFKEKEIDVILTQTHGNAHFYVRAQAIEHKGFFSVAKFEVRWSKEYTGKVVYWWSEQNLIHNVKMADSVSVSEVMPALDEIQNMKVM